MSQGALYYLPVIYSGLKYDILILFGGASNIYSLNPIKITEFILFSSLSIKLYGLISP